MKLLLASFALLTILTARAPAQRVCSTLTIRGDWGVTCSGHLAPGENAPLMPIRILGTCSSTWDGVFTCEGWVSLGGTILAQTMTGRAIVNDNCTGTIRYTQTLNGAPAPDMNIRFLVFDNGKLIKGLPIDRGANLACTLQRM